MFGNLISMGMANPSGALEFCQALIQVLDRHAGFVGQTEKLLKLWLCIAYPLLDHIKKVSFTIIFMKNQKAHKGYPSKDISFPKVIHFLFFIVFNLFYK